MKIEPCPYCRSICAEPVLFDVYTSNNRSLNKNIKVECRCGLAGPTGSNNIEAISEWNWLSKAVSERDYYREKIIQFEIEHKK